MTPLQQATAAGMTHVMTFAGKIPFNAWNIAASEIDEFDLEAGCIYGPWRQLNSVEKAFADENPSRGYIKARDNWPVCP